MHHSHMTGPPVAADSQYSKQGIELIFHLKCRRREIKSYRSAKMQAIWLILLAMHHGVSALTSATACDPAMLGKCSCGRTLYEGTLQYVVNCTDTKFNDTFPLQHLPLDTEVLIFTGNYIQELPWNVFGTLQDYPNLRVVDMSNNQIRKILGKSYHRVSIVQRLILNHNQISIAEEDHHPRMFSNFVNLEELHLTNAFEDSADNLGIDLHDVFVSSNLNKLIKLHLEQNEVKKFKDGDVFCDLPSLMDLHLGDNSLSALDFRIDCLKHLRFIDLEGNNMTRLTKTEMSALDALPARNQNLTIDLTDNPFSCECGIHDIFTWLNVTKVQVRNSYQLRCHRPDGELPPKHPENIVCSSNQAVQVTFAQERADTAAIILSFLSVIILSLLVALIYNNRKTIRSKFQPMVDTVSRKVYYSSIGHNDDHEIDV